MPINDFKAIATFAKAVELGSIRQAALAQGVTPQAASQAIAQLESSGRCWGSRISMQARAWLVARSLARLLLMQLGLALLAVLLIGVS